MALLKQKKSKKSLVASAERITTNGRKNPFKHFGDSEWQAESWRLYDIIGEQRFVSNFMGGAISRGRLYVAEVNESGEAGEEVKMGPIAELAATPLGSGPARDENQRLLGVGLFVPGESFIVGEGVDLNNPGETEDDVWFVVSGGEIQNTGGQITINRPPHAGGGRMIFRDGTDVLIRCFTPHPRNASQPDSPTRAAIPVLRELELLTKREFAELDSRLTGAGVMPMPEGIDFPRGDDDPGGLSGFMGMLAKAQEASVQDQSSAAAMQPVMFTVPDALYEAVAEHMGAKTFWSELSEQIPTLKTQAIHRLSLAYDIPPDVLTGTGGGSRFHAWLSDEQVIKIHVQPLFSRIAYALTLGYLHPALESMGEDPDAYTFAFDAAALTVRPNRTKDALDFWDRFMVSDAAARDAGAFGDTSPLPDDEERLRRIATAAVERDPSLLIDPGIQALLGATKILGGSGTPAGKPLEIGPAGAEEDRPLPPSQSGEDSDDDTESDNLVASATASMSAPQVSAEALLPAATLSVLRALELAGGRLTNPGDRRHKWPGVPRHQLHVKVGAVSRETATKALKGAWDHCDVIASGFDLDKGSLVTMLDGYCMELLTRGLAHDDDLLRAAMLTAVAGRKW